MSKLCSKCKIQKDESCFGIKPALYDGLNLWCKTCANKASIKYRANLTPEKKAKIRFHQREYKNSIKGKLRGRDWAYKRKFGITLDQYNAMFQKQNGNCLICEVNQSILKYKLHIDHNHKTNKVRGLLCAECNRALGLMKDDLNIIMRAFNYIKEKDGK